MQSTVPGHDHDKQQKWKIIQHIRAARLSKDISQERLANIVGCAPRTIMSLEGGLIALEALLLMKICAVLGLSIDEIAKDLLEKSELQNARQIKPSRQQGVPIENGTRKTPRSSSTFN